MKEPIVTLKNVKTFIGREGNGLNADVYINGIKCLFARDDAGGGGMDIDRLYHPKNPVEVEANIALLDAWIKLQPQEEYKMGGKIYKLDYTLELHIDNIFNKMEEDKSKKKFQAKMVKLFETAIVFGVPDTDAMSHYNFHIPLSTYPQTNLQSFIDEKVKPQCTGGVKILNTNLEALGIKV